MTYKEKQDLYKWANIWCQAESSIYFYLEAQHNAWYRLSMLYGIHSIKVNIGQPTKSVIF